MTDVRFRARATAALLVALMVAASAARAAEAPERALAGRLEPAALAAVSRLLGEARAAGLPDEPLLATALEGASRHATSDRIVRALRRQTRELAAARTALQPPAGEAEIVAGASALRAGVPAEALARLRVARPSRPLVTTLVVLADLVTRGVPVERAASTVLDLTRGGAADADLLRFRERVAQDVRAGASPGEAVVLRARGVALEIRTPADAPAALVPPSGTRPR